MAMDVRKIKVARPARPARVPEDRPLPELWRPPLSYPTPPNGNGSVYRWIRLSLQGVPDQNNLSRRYREGWRPVNAGEFPELMLISDEEGDAEHIVIGGLILCRASEDIMTQRKRYYEELTARQMDTVDRSMYRVEDKRMPMFSERSSSTTLGRRPA